MLIEFRVKNFRSFQDETVLNFAASSDKTNEELSVKETGNKSVPRIVRAVGIYGANASGKSNFIRRASPSFAPPRVNLPERKPPARGLQVSSPRC